MLHYTIRNVEIFIKKVYFIIIYYFKQYVSENKTNFYKYHVSFLLNTHLDFLSEFLLSFCKYFNSVKFLSTCILLVEYVTYTLNTCDKCLALVLL